MKNLMILCAAAVILAACSDASTAPAGARKAAPRGPSRDDVLTCRSGYVVYYDENGEPYCAPAPPELTDDSTSTGGFRAEPMGGRIGQATKPGSRP